MNDRSMEAELAAWGKVILLQTKGRHSGRMRTTAVGFVPVAGGGFLVAASAATTDWAANLGADPTCEIELEGARRAYLASPLDAAERAAAIAQLILKYGAPAERLGAGPAFRLDPQP